MSEILRRNWGYKLVSVLLALLLWLWVSNQARPESTLAVTLQPKGLPQSMVVVNQLPSTVSVRVKGPDALIKDTDVSASIDLSQAGKGNKSYPVIVSAPAGYSVVSVDPDHVTVNVDEVKEKSFPVDVVTQGSVASGFTAGTPIVRPALVTVRGTANELAQISKVFVVMNLDDASETVEDSAAIQLLNAAGKPIVGANVSPEPNEVSVIIPVIKKELASSMVPLIANTTGTPGKGFAVSQIIASPEAVKIYGPASKLKDIDSIDCGTIDVSGATQDIVKDIDPGNLSLPGGVSLEPGVKITIVVHLGATPIQRTLGAVPIKVKNLVNGLQATLSAQTVNGLVVKGLPNAVNRLKESDISLWVDLKGFVAGQQSTVPVAAQLPAGIQVTTLPTITVNVK